MKRSVKCAFLTSRLVKSAFVESESSFFVDANVWMTKYQLLAIQAAMGTVVSGKAVIYSHVDWPMNIRANQVGNQIVATLAGLVEREPRSPDRFHERVGDDVMRLVSRSRGKGAF